MFENLDEQFGSRSGPKIFRAWTWSKPLVKFISRHLLCRHTFHMKYPVLHSQILKKKWNTTKLTSSNIMRSLSIHCLFTHWHLKLYKKINKKCEFNILVLVLLVTRSVCGTFYIFLLLVLYVTWWGMWNPFYIFLAFDLYVTRWVCETLFICF